MRRVLPILLVALLTFIPLTGATAGADDCPTLSGTAKLDWGRTQTGKAKLRYDDAKIKVDFVELSFTPTNGNTADVEFDWFFPDGTVSIVEHSVTTPIAGPLVGFNSTIDVVAGGTGSWTWSGVSNQAAGIAHIDLQGTLCIDS